MINQIKGFNFNPSEWLLGRISNESLRIQGAFIKCCSLYWVSAGTISSIDIHKKVDEKAVTYLVEHGYIGYRTGGVIIIFLDEQLAAL